ncbi:MAG: hypothetical protein NTW17_01110, partial [Candidatus Pacearchaeota archaeon]|nr:hypothetical protein [Candidatus Pacearchaeota archaeon]
TIDSGLSRLFLGRGLDLGSGGDSLAYSSGSGRVVVVSAEGGSQDFDKYLIKLKQVRDEEVAKLDGKLAQAEALIRGKQ